VALAGEELGSGTRKKKEDDRGNSSSEPGSEWATRGRVLGQANFSREVKSTSIGFLDDYEEDSNSELAMGRKLCRRVRTESGSSILNTHVQGITEFERYRPKKG